MTKLQKCFNAFREADKIVADPAFSKDECKAALLKAATMEFELGATDKLRLVQLLEMARLEKARP